MTRTTGDDHLLLMERGFERVEKKLLWKAGEYKTEISLLNGERKAVYSNGERYLRRYYRRRGS